MISTGVTDAAKLQFLTAVANSDCRLALYTGDASIGTNTKRYTTVGEVVGKGYTPGGIKMKNGRAWSRGAAACVTWDDVVWPNATITAGGFMIYDAANNDTALFVGGWGANYSSTNGPFTVVVAEDQITFE